LTQGQTQSVIRRRNRTAFNIDTECCVMRFSLYSKAYTTQRFYDSNVYQTYHISQDDEGNGNPVKITRQKQSCMSETTCACPTALNSRILFHKVSANLRFIHYLCVWCTNKLAARTKIS